MVRNGLRGQGGHGPPPASPLQGVRVLYNYNDLHHILSSHPDLAESKMIVPASYVSKAHTILASAAFLSALIIGLRLHYFKIVKNEVAGYPDEWWPSVSATYV